VENCVLGGGNDVIPFPEGEFDIILADPPWQYEKGTTIPKKTIEAKYSTMSLDDICNLQIPSKKDALLFLWCPAPLIESGLRVISSWGFSYRTCMVWDKQIENGMGHWLFTNHELILLGVKGNFPTPPDHLRPKSIFRVPRGRHSEKPVYVNNLLREMYPWARRLELFARMKREGWISWGNEIKGSECRTLEHFNGGNKNVW
jgi:N6-adenosine-specific RNA methylase IME4